MARPILTLAFAATVATAACGGGSAEGSVDYHYTSDGQTYGI